jgi:hypothetical protein
MQPKPIVEYLDVLEDRYTGSSSALKRSIAAELSLQRLEERFSRCIIPAISLSAHALPQSVSRKPPAKRVAAVLGSSV